MISPREGPIFRESESWLVVAFAHSRPLLIFYGWWVFDITLGQTRVSPREMLTIWSLFLARCRLRSPGRAFWPFVRILHVVIFKNFSLFVKHFHVWIPLSLLEHNRVAHIIILFVILEVRIFSNLVTSTSISILVFPKYLFVDPLSSWQKRIFCFELLFHLLHRQTIHL